MKRFLRIFMLLLLVAVLLIPAASAKYKEDFGFGLGKMGTAALGLNNADAAGLSASDINDRAKKGFDIVYSANHLYAYAGSNHSTGTQQQLQNLPEGYYAFIIRGGDGGQGRSNGTPAASFGGLGGYVVGYVWLAANTTLYIEVGSAGIGVITATNSNRPHYGGGTNVGRGGQGGGLTLLAISGRPHSQNSDIIAVAGGGGGGGGANKGVTFPSNNIYNSWGGSAGGAGTIYGWQAANHFRVRNPILNGAGTVFIPSINGGAQVQRVFAVTGGFVIPGVQGGADGAQMLTTAPGTSGNNGGGGGGVSGGGNGGTAAGNGGALSGGPAVAATFGGGGGGGWFGGGGGTSAANNENGGGGGGSSYIRSDVRPLTSTMLTSTYFDDLIKVQTRDALSELTGITAFLTSHANASTLTIGNSTSGMMTVRNHSFIASSEHQGMSGFAFIKYLGPNCPTPCAPNFVCPNPAPCPALTGFQTWGSWPFGGTVG